ncbi:hypothetical protein JS518_14115 [Clostridiales bacterium FE2010]|nr:hypothetical protein JS518_14115 [Clostridiales bacterium FE2010]
MKKGIRCNEVRFTNGDKRDRIKFEFVSDDGVTPSSCTVCVGDIDPMTGEKITDVTFFREYYRVVDHEVHQNLKAEKREYTQEEKKRRERERKRYIAAFVRRFGYAPSKDNVRLHLELLEEERQNLSVEVYISQESGEDMKERHPEMSMSMDLEEEEPMELQALREVVAELTGRKAEVYEAMVQRAAGGKERLRFSDIARRWGVAPKQITKDQVKIKDMIKKKLLELQLEKDTVVPYQ